MPKKMKATRELVLRAKRTFDSKGVVRSGDGLSRTELRALERHGYIRRYRRYNGKSAALHYEWRWIPLMSEESGVFQ